MKIIFRLPYFLLLALSIFVIGCSSSTQLSSLRAPNDISIDGDASEWSSDLTYLKDQHISLGIRNDDQFLYICLMSSEGQFRRQIMGLGLTMSFQKESDGKMLGIHYPVGMIGKGKLREAFNGNNDGGDIDREKMLEEALQDIEIIGPTPDNHRTFSTMQTSGVTAKIKTSQDLVTYELKIPLHKSTDFPYAIEADTGSTVNLKIETGKFEGRMGGGAMRTGMPEGGGERTGRGGRRGNRMPSEGGERPDGDRPEPLNFEAIVHIAGK